MAINKPRSKLRSFQERDQRENRETPSALRESQVEDVISQRSSLRTAGKWLHPFAVLAGKLAVEKVRRTAGIIYQMFNQTYQRPQSTNNLQPVAGACDYFYCDLIGLDTRGHTFQPK